jgi:hypothetical protein
MVQAYDLKKFKKNYYVTGRVIIKIYVIYPQYYEAVLSFQFTLIYTKLF